MRAHIPKSKKKGTKLANEPSHRSAWHTRIQPAWTPPSPFPFPLTPRQREHEDEKRLGIGITTNRQNKRESRPCFYQSRAGRRKGSAWGVGGVCCGRPIFHVPLSLTPIMRVSERGGGKGRGGAQVRNASRVFLFFSFSSSSCFFLLLFRPDMAYARGSESSWRGGRRWRSEAKFHTTCTPVPSGQQGTASRERVRAY